MPKRRFRNKRKSVFNGRQNRGRMRQKIDFTGIRTAARSIPRSAQDAPWNEVVVQRTVSLANNSTFIVTCTYVRDILANQLHVDSGSNLTFRIIAVTVNDLAGRPIEIASYNFTTNASLTNNQLTTALSWPGRNTWSGARFVWPKAISAASLSFDGDNPRTVISGGIGTPVGIVNTDATTALLRFNILWRVTQTATVPTIKGVDGIAVPPCSSLMRSIMAPDKINNESVIIGVNSVSHITSDMEELGIHMDNSL